MLKQYLIKLKSYKLTIIHNYFFLYFNFFIDDLPCLYCLTYSSIFCVYTTFLSSNIEPSVFILVIGFFSEKLLVIVGNFLLYFSSFSVIIL